MTFKEAVNALTPEKQFQLGLRLAKLAMPIWDEFAAKRSHLEFIEDGPFRKPVSVDKNLLKNTLDAVEEYMQLPEPKELPGKIPTFIKLEEIYLSLILALQWSDWVVTGPALKTFYSVHNLMDQMKSDKKNTEGETLLFVSINQSADALTASNRMTFDDIHKIILEYANMENKGIDIPPNAPIKKENINTMNTNYKFKDLKTYSSDEWMVDGTKKYRKVFDQMETTYMWAELSFYNKLFDEADWEASIRLKCFYLKGSQKNELCNIEEKKTILKTENLVFSRRAWGNANPGSYWLKGDYVWEGYVNDEKIGESKFYVDDVGLAQSGNIPHFDIESIKLFEGDLDATSLKNKKYLTKFNREETRYVWAEFTFKNKTPKDYFAEIIFNFYDDAGQYKGKSSPSPVYVEANKVGQSFTVYPGWGSTSSGTWKDDRYTMQVVFMDTLIATVPFEMGTQVEEGLVATITDADQMLKQAAKTGITDTKKSLEEVLNESLAELNSLTGLHSIKTEVDELVKLVRFYQETGKDILNKFSLHTVFSGNPGTGKTTVARILSRIYKGLGILEKGHLVEVDRETLVAGYIGQTAIKTGEKINEAMGGILFIDEAYSLAQAKGSQNDFGAESIQVILKRMEDFRGKFGVIVAGYTDNMQEFITSNPGLKSRFDKTFLFEDYLPEDMFKICLSIFKKEEVDPDEAAATHLRNYFEYLHAGRDKNFGNARNVRQVVAESVKNQNLRLAAIPKDKRTKEMLETIILDDVKEFEIKETKKEAPKFGFRYSGNS